MNGSVASIFKILDLTKIHSYVQLNVVIQNAMHLRHANMCALCVRTLKFVRF